MKTYLNSKQRRQYCQLAAMMGAAEEIVNEWAAHDGLTMPERKALRTAITNIDKTLISIVRRMAPDEGRRLLKTAKATESLCIPKETAAQFKRRIEEEAAGEGVWISQDALDTIIEMALCRGCNPCQMPGAGEQCPLRVAMMELEVPVLDSNPPDGVCPWDLGAIKKVDGMEGR